MIGLATQVAICVVVSASAGEATTSAAAAYRNAQFVDTLAIVNRAKAASSGLSRGDVVALLELEALAHFALADSARMKDALGRLALLDPRHPLGREVPPPVRGAFSDVTATSEPLAISGQIIETGGSVRFTLTAPSDHLGLIRGLTVRCRSDLQPWLRAAGAMFEFPAREDERIECVGEAIGYGGAKLLEASAIRAGAAAPPPPPEIGPITTSKPEDSDPTLWPWLAGGTAAVVVAVIVAFAVVGAEEPATILSGPSVDDLR